MNCACLSLAAQSARLAQVERQAGTPQTLEREDGGPAPRSVRHRSTSAYTAPRAKRRRTSGLAQKVDTMTTEFEEIKALLASLQPAQGVQGYSVPAEAPPAGQTDVPPPLLSPAVEAQEEDALSTRDSESLDLGQGEADESYESASQGSHCSSQGTGQSTARGSEVCRPTIKPTVKAASSSQDFCDASLQAFAYMSRELGRLVSFLTLARRQIWLAQSPLVESGRRALRSLPVVSGELFGVAAQQALERSA